MFQEILIPDIQQQGFFLEILCKTRLFSLENKRVSEVVETSKPRLEEVGKPVICLRLI